MFSVRSNPCGVKLVFGWALFLCALGLVTAIGGALQGDVCTTTSFTPVTVGITIGVLCTLTFMVFGIGMCVAVNVTNNRTRVRNIIFMLSIGLFLASQWFKWATATLLGCEPNAWTVVNLASASLMIVWFAIVIWVPSLTH